MTQEEGKKLFNLLCSLHPPLKKEMSEDMILAYWRVLRSYRYEDVREAVFLRAQREKFYPTASEIVEYLPEQVEERKSQKLDHWTRDAARKLLDCSDEKCGSCPDKTTCRLKNPVGVTDSKATVTMEVT